jgi:hypothetical protein
MPPGMNARLILDKRIIRPGKAWTATGKDFHAGPEASDLCHCFDF